MLFFNFNFLYGLKYFNLFNCIIVDKKKIIIDIGMMIKLTVMVKMKMIKGCRLVMGKAQVPCFRSLRY